MTVSLSAAALSILQQPDAAKKAVETRRAAAAWRDGAIAHLGRAAPPDRPARPVRPELRLPKDMPRRRLKSIKGRIALLHAVQHIELNAIDLAWDLIARFAPELSQRPAFDLSAFLDDWISVADDEARHFQLLSRRLADLDAVYGDLPAHDGLWDAAIQTKDDVLARLAVVPLVLEARGLDVAPNMIRNLDAGGDRKSADILRLILREEIGHVAIGRRWFTTLCEKETETPQEIWKRKVSKYFRGQLKPPFNEHARSAAGFSIYHYQDLTVIGAQ